MSTSTEYPAVRTVLRSRPMAGRPQTMVDRVHVTAGREGARVRDREAHGVLFASDGARHGQWFKTAAEADRLFSDWTT